MPPHLSAGEIITNVSRFLIGLLFRLPVFYRVKLNTTCIPIILQTSVNEMLLQKKYET